MHHLAWPQHGAARAAAALAGKGSSAAGAPRASATAAAAGTGRPGSAAARGVPGQGQRVGMPRDPYTCEDAWLGVARGHDLDVPGRSLSPQVRRAAGIHLVCPSGGQWSHGSGFACNC